MKDRSVSAPSDGQLAVRVAAQEPIIVWLQVWIVEQAVRMGEPDAQIAALKRQLAAALGSASQPPSVNRLGKPAPKPLRGRFGCSPGGLPGRQGYTLRQVAVAEAVVGHNRAPVVAAVWRWPQLRGWPGWFGGRCSTSRRSPCGWLGSGWCPAAAPVAGSPRLSGRPGSPRRALRPAHRGDRDLSVLGPAAAGAPTARRLAKLFDTPIAAGSGAA